MAGNTRQKKPYSILHYSGPFPITTRQRRPTKRLSAKLGGDFNAVLKKLSKGEDGTFKWRIELRMPKSYVKPRICTNFDGTEAEAHAMYGELLAVRARSKVGLEYKAPTLRAPALPEACGKYESYLRSQGRTDQYVSDVVTELGHLQTHLGKTIPMNAIARGHLLGWLKYREGIPWRGKKPGPRTMNKVLSMISPFFVFARDVAGWITESPVTLPKSKETKPLPKILSWQTYLEISAMAWADRPLFAILLEVLAESGARVEEVLQANVGDIAIARRVWRKKVKPGRFVEPDAMEWTIWCATDRDADEPLCVNEMGQRWSYYTVRNAFHKYRAGSAQPKLMPHYLRHARACWLLAEGMNPHRVKDFLCHSTINTTELYTKAAEQIRREETPGTVHKNLCHPYDKVPSKVYYKRHCTATAHKGNKGFKRLGQKGLKCKLNHTKDNGGVAQRQRQRT